MGQLVIFDLDGDLDQGVNVTLEIRSAWETRRDRAGLLLKTRRQGKLPPCPQLSQQYRHWQTLYRQLLLLYRLEERANPVTNGSRTTAVTTCQQEAQLLTQTFNHWLQAEPFRPLREQLLAELDPREPVWLLLQVPNDTLRRLPWHLWEVLAPYPQAEVALSPPIYDRIEPIVSSRQQLRVLAVFGHRADIDVDGDRRLFESLPHPIETVFLVEPSPQQLTQYLWQPQGWDIFFFAGHSASHADGTTGQIALNSHQCIGLESLSYALKQAIARGLRLAIFNSCDGLGLARSLERLHLPQTIVMREPVPDTVAQAFLKHFLTALARGEALYLAVRQAREQLQSLETHCPGATWLPILCQNPTAHPDFWQTSQFIPTALRQHPCPYRGLAAFQETDAPFFFGREIVTAKLHHAVQQRPLVTLIGASGSGKSSLVFAGLIPQLRQQGNWLIASLRPGDRPFWRLAAALLPWLEPCGGTTDQLVETQKLATALQQGDIILADIIDRIQSRSPAPCQLLLVVDQLEELYTLCPSTAERQQFQDTLLAALHSHTPFTLVATLRADFLESALSYRPMADALSANPPELLTPMSRTELAAAITQPAQHSGLQMADGLTERLLDAVGVATGNLPLLEFTLTRLWEQQNDGSLTHEAYDHLGGVEQALAQYAEQVYGKLDADAQNRTQHIFTQLVHLGEGTADTRRFATATEIGAANWQVVCDLVAARLIVIRQADGRESAVVEIVHEALIQHWGRLQQWLAADRSFRLWQERLRVAMRQWHANHRSPDALWQGVLLLEAQHWYEQRQSSLSRQEQDFIHASFTHQTQIRRQRDRQRRRSVASLTSGCVTVVVLASLAIWQWQRIQFAQVNAQLDAASTSVAELSAVGLELEALVASIHTGWQLKQFKAHPHTRTQVITSLQQLLYESREFNRLDGHTRTVIATGFSPDGQMLASASDDRTVRLWRRDGELLATLRGHEDLVRSVSFSPNGKILASASYDHRIRLWQPDGESVAVLTGHSDKVNSVSFSPDGQLFASASADRTVRIWQTDVNGIPQSGAIALNAHPSWVLAVSFSPDSQIIASAGSDGTVRLWQRDGTPVDVLQAQQGSIRSISFSPDGQSLAAATNQGEIVLWQRNHQGKFSSPQVLTGHRQKVWRVRFSPNGQFLASAGADRSVKLWRRDGTLVTTLDGHTASVHDVSFSPDSQILASASRTTIRLWYTNQRQRPRLQGHVAAVNHIRFSPDGEILATVSDDRTLRLWRRHGKHLATLRGHQQSIHRLEFSLDGRLIATASADGTVKLWTIQGQLQQTLPHQAGVRDVAFSSDGQWLATAGDDARIGLWRQRSTGKFAVHHFLRGHQGQVLSVAFSPDGQRLASGGKDETVKLWRWDSGENPSWRLEQTLTGHSSWIDSISFSPNGQLLASASADSSVKLWRRDGSLQTTLLGHRDQVKQVAFSPDGQTLASASSDRTIKFWSLQGTLLQTLKGHDDQVLSLDYHPDGQTLASASRDRTAILWNLNLDELLEQGCVWSQDYLWTNSTLTPSDRRVCPLNSSVKLD